MPAFRRRRYESARAHPDDFLPLSSLSYLSAVIAAYVVLASPLVTGLRIVVIKAQQVFPIVASTCSSSR